MNQLTLPLAVAFLYFIGAMGGWVLEFFFRNLISHKGPKGRYFINPGFCKGPWLPIYGIGLSVMCIMSVFVYENLDPGFVNSIAGDIVVILILGLVMNLIEFTGGFILLKGFNMRLWDYRQMPGNIMGIVCPQFALIWTAISAIYYLFIHQISIDNLIWFSQHLTYAFFVGLFFGFFLVDLWSSFIDASIIKAFANDHNVVIKYEDLKATMLTKLMETDQKQHFFNQILINGLDINTSLEGCAMAMEKK